MIFKMFSILRYILSGEKIDKIKEIMTNIMPRVAI
jgi:hypothetical protein